MATEPLRKTIGVCLTCLRTARTCTSAEGIYYIYRYTEMGASFNNEERDQQERTPSTKVTCLLIALTGSSILSSLLYGYCNGIMSGALVYMRTDMSLNDLWQQLIVSVSFGVAAIVTFCSGFLNMRFGRKPIILASSVLFIIGSLVLAFAPSKAVLLIGRVVIGLGIGSSAGTVSPYVAECAPPRVRGQLLVLCEIAKTCGVLLAALVAAFLSYVKDENLNWRVMLGLGAVPALVQLLGFSFMPESPRWLSLKGREEEAYSAMLRIYGGDEAAGKEAEIELNAIKAAQAKMEKEKDEAGVGKVFNGA